MIISASRRTDIPAFFGEWFMNRIRAGYCTVANPFNPQQVSTVALGPEDVDCFVFWTRYPVSLAPHLPELVERGYQFLVLFTVLDYPRELEPHLPPLPDRIRAFQSLSDRYGPDRIAWRYDPILLSRAVDASFHRDRFAGIASRLRGYTHRVIISFFDAYPKARSRLSALAEGRYGYLGEPEDTALQELILPMVEVASEGGMTITSCAEKLDLGRYGVPPGACIDPMDVERITGRQVTRRKDPGQRKLCRCAVSRDIGAYETCRFGCVYCYATNSSSGSRPHDPHAESLVGC